MPDYNTDLAQWKPEGRGTIDAMPDGGWEVHVETPFTLWCPDEAPGDVEISFENQVMVENSAMLLIAGARNWRGKPLMETERTGQYDDYARRDMESYTIGFNRAAHVTDDIQPNASSANVRRIGGAVAQDFAGISPADKSPEGQKRWWQWDTTTRLVSAREPASGTDRYYRYTARFERPRISLYLEDELLFTVVDHRPEPLQGGFIAIRNMTSGGAYRIRNIEIRDL